MNSESHDKKGWSDGFWSKDEITEVFLDKQRRFMWNRDYWIKVLVPLFKLRPDSVILDVGCGLGFLGQNLAEFVPRGRIIGLDLDSKLIEMAKKIAAEDWPNHVFDYRVGSAYDLPMDKDSVDFSICQCVLMHLEDPAKAISEMRRVIRKSGRVVVMEPDYSSLSMFDSAFEKMNYSLDERVKFLRWEMLRKLGKKKLGKGDDDIGSKIPGIFHQIGLEVVDVRCFDRVFCLIPPYDKEANDLELEQMKLPPEFYFNTLDTRKEFLTGGGTEAEFEEYLNLLKKEHDVRQQQIKEKTFLSSIIQSLTITIGTKA